MAAIVVVDNTYMHICRPRPRVLLLGLLRHKSALGYWKSNNW